MLLTCILLFTGQDLYLREPAKQYINTHTDLEALSNKTAHSNWTRRMVFGLYMLVCIHVTTTLLVYTH